MGAGHVGKALSRLAAFSGFHVTVADDRTEFANRDTLPDAHDIAVGDYSMVLRNVPVGPATFIVIATRGHNHDLDAVQAALRTDAGYIGLLGSRRKKGLLMNSLRDAGFSAEDVARVIIPVGLPIGSVTPEEIAVSIMAQIIRERRDHAASRIGSAACSGIVSQDGPAKAASAPER
jgi:xanthine dehydrogenase accessory factor